MNEKDYPKAIFVTTISELTTIKIFCPYCATEEIIPYKDFNADIKAKYDWRQEEINCSTCGQRLIIAGVYHQDLGKGKGMEI